MGFFSWKTSDTNQSISNTYSNRGPLPVYLVTPNNEKIYEDDYEGYGIFGGYDAYALLAKWNKPELCNGDTEHDRIIGIELECKHFEKIKYPLKFSVSPKKSYNELPAAIRDDCQGYFYDDDEDEY